jgi:hypothetical protein
MHAIHANPRCQTQPSPRIGDVCVCEFVGGFVGFVLRQLHSRNFGKVGESHGGICSGGVELICSVGEAPLTRLPFCGSIV